MMSTKERYYCGRGLLDVVEHNEQRPDVLQVGDQVVLYVVKVVIPVPVHIIRELVQVRLLEERGKRFEYGLEGIEFPNLYPEEVMGLEEVRADLERHE